MTTLADLIAQRSALEEQIKTLTAAQRTDAIAKVKAVMEENGLTMADIGAGAKSRANGERNGQANPPKKVAAKCRDGAQNSWSGRGLQPKWLKAAIAAGKKIEDFAI